MKTNVIIIDDFYNNPNEVRAFALSQNFSVLGNYPGRRTVPFINQGTKDVIQRIIQPHGGNVTDWLDGPGQYTGSFQLCMKDDKTWIHADIHNIWAGVCYLSPNAPLNAGTMLYQHKATGQYEYVDSFHNGNDYSAWDQVDYIANKFNRLVLYRGNIFHASHNYFGDTMETARLFQTFFFNTEY
jgi:hypothetical protein